MIAILKFYTFAADVDYFRSGILAIKQGHNSWKRI